MKIRPFNIFQDMACKLFLIISEEDLIGVSLGDTTCVHSYDRLFLLLFVSILLQK